MNRFRHTILIDTAEQLYWPFKQMPIDGKTPMDIDTEWRCLGRHPNSLGDYSVDGYEGVMHVERKSVLDLIGTLLDFDGRRDRFEQELSNLERIKYGAVIVEGHVADILAASEQRGKKSVSTIRKVLYRSMMGYQTDYRVPWFFCGDTRAAEVTCFRFFQRAIRKTKEGLQAKSIKDVI